MRAKAGATLTRIENARQVAWVLWLTLALNWLCAVLKIVFGLWTHCMVIVADGLHSFSDGASNAAALVGISISGHPADRDHPYGHQKYETLASTIIAFLLFAVSLSVFQKAVAGFIHPGRPEVNALSFFVMGASFFVNLFVVIYERSQGRRLKSDLLISDSWHTLSDLFVTLSVLAALAGIRLNMPRLDSFFSLGIAILIAVIGLRILKHSSDILCDKAVLDSAEVEKVVRGIEGVVDCHEIRTRGKKEEIYLDLHVLVPSDMTVLASHELANTIEKELRRCIRGIYDTVVHIEPAGKPHGGNQCHEP